MVTGIFILFEKINLNLICYSHTGGNQEVNVFLGGMTSKLMSLNFNYYRFFRSNQLYQNLQRLQCDFCPSKSARVET